jgi:hypothetical protein
MTMTDELMDEMDNFRCNWEGMYGIDECSGHVEYRLAMSPSGISYPGCDAHFEARWQEQERISSTSGVPLTYYGNEYDGYSVDYSDY